VWQTNASACTSSPHMAHIMAHPMWHRTDPTTPAWQNAMAVAAHAHCRPCRGHLEPAASTATTWNDGSAIITRTEGLFGAPAKHVQPIGRGAAHRPHTKCWTPAAARLAGAYIPLVLATPRLPTMIVTKVNTMQGDAPTNQVTCMPQAQCGLSHEPHGPYGQACHAHQAQRARAGRAPCRHGMRQQQSLSNPTACECKHSARCSCIVHRARLHHGARLHPASLESCACNKRGAAAGLCACAARAPATRGPGNVPG